MSGTLGGMSHVNHAFRDYSVRADKIQLSKCNARIHSYRILCWGR